MSFLPPTALAVPVLVQLQHETLDLAGAERLVQGSGHRAELVQRDGPVAIQVQAVEQCAQGRVVPDGLLQQFPEIVRE